jgi:hypothetical protein
MSPLIGWGLAVVAVVGGFLAYGWQGLVLAISVVVFWLLLQFSRALRVMRGAAANPVGHTDNAVMLQSRLRPGMRMLQVVALARSLGRKTADAPETFVWQDPSGDAVQVVLARDVVGEVKLLRGTTAAPPPPADA